MHPGWTAQCMRADTQGCVLATAPSAGSGRCRAYAHAVMAAVFYTCFLSLQAVLHISMRCAVHACRLAQEGKSVKGVCRPQAALANFEGVVEQRVQELGRQEQDLHLILLRTCQRLNAFARAGSTRGGPKAVVALLLCVVVAEVSLHHFASAFRLFSLSGEAPYLAYAASLA